MTTCQPYTQKNTQVSILCLVCGEPLTVRPARGRKSGKPFLMLMCGRDGRHFRAFVNDQAYVQGVLDRLESQTRPEQPEDGPQTSAPPPWRVLEHIWSAIARM